MLDYQKILRENMINVLKDILINIKENGLSDLNQLYITFLTKHKNVKVPDWLLEKYPKEMTIVLQYEYYDLKINKESFVVTLSFDNIKTGLQVSYDSIISFADPSANFGLKLKTKKSSKNNKKQIKDNKENVISFSDFKKN